MLYIRSLVLFLCILLAISASAQRSTTLRCFSYQPLAIPSAQATEQFYGVIVNAPSGAKKLYNPFQYTSYPDYVNIFDAKTNINVKYTDVKLSRPEFLAYLHACRCGLVDTAFIATKDYVNSQGFITLLALSATMPLTYNNTTGNFSTSINPNKLTGRYSLGGAGPLQEIDPGFGLDLTTAGDLDIDTDVIASSSALNDSIQDVRSDLADSLITVVRSGDDISELNNDAGYVDAAGAALAAPIQSITGTAVDNTDSANPVIDATDLTGYLQIGDTLNLLATQYYVNDQGFITGVDWADIGGTQTDIDLNGFSNADGFLKSGDDVSELDNDAGYLTGNQSITLTGDISGTGTTSISTTLQNGSVTPLKIADGSVQTAKIATNAVTDEKFRQGASASVVGVTGASTANVADIVSTSNTALRNIGGTLSFGLITGSIISANGNRIPFGSGGGTLTEDADFSYFNDDLYVGSGFITSSEGYKVNNAAPLGQYLRGNGTTFVSSALTASDLPANSITDGLIRQSAGLSVIGRSANSTGNVADITSTTNGHFLVQRSNALGFGPIQLADVPAMNSQIVFGSGGFQAQSADFIWDVVNSRLGIGAGPVRDLDVSKSTASFLSIRINNSGTGSSRQEIVVSGASAGDPFTAYTVAGVLDYSIGIDNSDSDKFKINQGASPSAGLNIFTFTATGEVGIGTSSPAAGTRLDVNGVINTSTGFRIANAATTGHVLRGNGTNFVSSTLAFADIVSKPTTLSGYGITDGISGSLTTGYLPKANGASSLTNSLLFETGQTVAVGTNTGIDAFTRFYVYGGTNGANLDVRPAMEYGDGYPQAIVDLQSKDFGDADSTGYLRSTFLVHYSSGASGTTFGTSNEELGLLQFNGFGSAIKSASAPIQIGIGSNEKMRVHSTGVAIGTQTPDASAILEVSSTTQGFLNVRMSEAQRDAIVSPEPGLELFCTDCTAIDASTGVKQVFNGTVWKSLW